MSSSGWAEGQLQAARSWIARETPFFGHVYISRWQKQHIHRTMDSNHVLENDTLCLERVLGEKRARQGPHHRKGLQGGCQQLPCTKPHQHGHSPKVCFWNQRIMKLIAKGPVLKLWKGRSPSTVSKWKTNKLGGRLKAYFQMNEQHETFPISLLTHSPHKLLVRTAKRSLFLFKFFNGNLTDVSNPIILICPCWVTTAAVHFPLSTLLIL